MTRNRLGHAFFFWQRDFSNIQINRILQTQLGFTVELMELNHKLSAFSPTKLDKYLKSNQKITLSFRDAFSDNRLDIFSQANNEVVGVFVNYAKYYHPIELMQLFFEHQPIVGYSFSDFDMDFQNSCFKSHFEMLQVSPPAHLKTYLNITKDVCYEIEDNPGRKKISKRGVWLVSCWRIWLGRRIQELVDIELLKALPLSNFQYSEDGALFIELYQNYLECDVPAHRQIQYKVRQCLNINKLVDEF
ncbi:MAG: hypothetical protein JSU09_17040 [Bacteroidetes bacterium]|nr:hypothetical protein [Bacteroidota bacterium]